MQGIIKRYKLLCRVAGICCAMLLIFSGCGDPGSAVVIQVSAGAETEETQTPVPAETEETQTQVPPMGTSETETAAIPGIIVHICGQVENPGVYELPEGSRVWDAVQAAGGFSEDADPDAVNLAVSLADGCKVTIPSQGETAGGAEDWYEDQAAGQTAGRSAASAAENAGGAGGLIDINRATASELTAIPGIGEVRAAAIVAYRETYGPFHTVEEIMNVTGIKEGLFGKIKGYITAGG